MRKTHAWIIEFQTCCQRPAQVVCLSAERPSSVGREEP